MLKVARQGVFWTVQGEGWLAGEPMVFIRLAGCSVGCLQCDTNYAPHEEVSEEEVVQRCVALRNQHRRAAYVWVTGGEPTDQDLTALNKMLWQHRFKPCLATSGIREAHGQWWCLSVSPHTPDFVQRSGSELKLVPGLNGLRLCDIDLQRCDFAYRWVQPMAGCRDSLKECCEWLKDNPIWRMSPQSHKAWGMA